MPDYTDWSLARSHELAEATAKEMGLKHQKRLCGRCEGSEDVHVIIPEMKEPGGYRRWNPSECMSDAVLWILHIRKTNRCKVEIILHDGSVVCKVKSHAGHMLGCGGADEEDCARVITVSGLRAMATLEEKREMLEEKRQLNKKMESDQS